MKTASWFTYRGAGRISISRGVPRDMLPGYRIFRALAPGPWFNSVSKAEYERRYAQQLAALDARRTWEELHRLAGDAEPVLLCYERPPFTATNWCHRRLAAAWLELAMGEPIPEHEPPLRATSLVLF